MDVVTSKGNVYSLSLKDFLIRNIKKGFRFLRGLASIAEDFILEKISNFGGRATIKINKRLQDSKEIIEL